MSTLEQRGASERRSAGFSSMEEAQDYCHTFVRDAETGLCLLCGMARGYPKH